MDTIFAVSSGQPPAAIAVLRISGPRAFGAAEALAGSLPVARRAGVRALRDSEGDILDRALVLRFPGPRSATGEDLVELHLHGGRAVVRAVESALARLPGLRQAEAGEFTRRALLNARIDLTEAEGLGDLLLAETEGQRRAALASAEGAVRRHVEEWRRQLLDVAAQVEAWIDHSDEDDVGQGAASLDLLRRQARKLGEAMQSVAEAPPVERLRDGIRVVLAGPPNAGKSTLLNRLAERDAAIVSPVAGTTRDRVEAPVVRNGIAYVLTDTAGLNDVTNDPIEAIGIARARDALAEADVILWLADSIPDRPAIWLHARADAEGRGAPHPGQLAVSALAGEGIEALWTRIEDAAAALLPRHDALALNRRQRELVLEAAAALRRGAAQEDLLMLAEELRVARQAFDAITGRTHVEALLDTLFARFCIGK